MPVNVESLLEPIPGAEPCGSDLRSHPIYIQIREARREEDTFAQGVWAHDIKGADYGLALKLAKEALSKRGKDLQVAAWMTTNPLPRARYCLTCSTRWASQFR